VLFRSTVLHLSHPSSCVEGIRPHHGLAAPHEEGVPYTNDEDWGLGAYREVPLGERVWRLEPPAAVAVREVGKLSSSRSKDGERDT
jgi:hypothetical protein